MNLSVHVLNSTCGGFFYILFLKCIWTMVICTICLVHIFYNLDFFFLFLHAWFLFPLKAWMECHVVFFSFFPFDWIPCCLWQDAIWDGCWLQEVRKRVYLVIVLGCHSIWSKELLNPLSLLRFTDCTYLFYCG